MSINGNLALAGSHKKNASGASFGKISEANILIKEMYKKASTKPGKRDSFFISGESTTATNEAVIAYNDIMEAKRKERQRIQEMLKEQSENLKIQLEAMQKEAERQRKILLIFTRIASGDKVHPKDEQFLAKNAPGLYFMALAMRAQKENPEEHDRITEDEEDTATETEESETGKSESSSAETVAISTESAEVSAGME